MKQKKKRDWRGFFYGVSTMFINIMFGFAILTIMYVWINTNMEIIKTLPIFYLISVMLSTVMLMMIIIGEQWFKVSD